MPIQKDLKRIVRARMQKTGESYTTARVHVVKKSGQSKPDYAAIAGMSDAAVKKQTGRDWAAWVETLDAVRAHEKPHREIAGYVHSLGTPDWWTQMVTVGYERIRGLRDQGQRRGGLYEASKSKTFNVPIATLFDACLNARKRMKWLGKKIVVRTSIPNKSMRITWDDGTRVQFNFLSKSASKSVLALTHERLPDKPSVNAMKVWWGEKLDALAAMLK